MWMPFLDDTSAHRTQVANPRTMVGRGAGEDEEDGGGVEVEVEGNGIVGAPPLPLLPLPQPQGNRKTGQLAGPNWSTHTGPGTPGPPSPHCLSSHPICPKYLFGGGVGNKGAAVQSNGTGSLLGENARRRLRRSPLTPAPSESSPDPLGYSTPPKSGGAHLAMRLAGLLLLAAAAGAQYAGDGWRPAFPNAGSQRQNPPPNPYHSNDVYTDPDYPDYRQAGPASGYPHQPRPYPFLPSFAWGEAGQRQDEALQGSRLCPGAQGSLRTGQPPEPLRFSVWPQQSHRQRQCRHWSLSPAPSEAERGWKWPEWVQGCRW